MEYEKITNLLGDNNSDKAPRFITKNWIEVYDQSGGTYNPNKQIRFKTPQLRSDLCDYNDAYILVTGKISVTNHDDIAYDRKLALKNNAPLFNCVTKINDQLTNDENENKLFEQLKTGFERKIKWDKYRSEISNQSVNNNLNHLIDPTFSSVNGLFVLAFENEEDRSSFLKYYTPTVEIKDYNVLIDQKPFFDLPIKNKEQTYEQIIELIRNGDYTTYNLLK